MLLEHFPETWRFRKAEWLLAGLTTNLGVVYTVNPHLFERPYFRSMVGMMPQGCWALLCLLVGLTRLAFLLINGSLPNGSPQVRCLGAVLSCGVWLALTIAAGLNEFQGQMLALCPLFLIFDGMVVRETAREWGATARRRQSNVARAV